MTRFWSRYAPYCHLAGWIITIIFIAGMKYNDASGYGDRINKLEADAQTVKELVARIDQKTDDIVDILRGNR
jgi:hypothetical protein